MSQRHYLITYDVADDKRRTRVFNTLQDHGDHAQFSVFFCRLTLSERAAHESSLTEMIDSAKDQVLFVDLGKSEHELAVHVTAVGKCYDPPVRSMIVGSFGTCQPFVFRGMTRAVCLWTHACPAASGDVVRPIQNPLELFGK